MKKSQAGEDIRKGDFLCYDKGDGLVHSLTKNKRDLFTRLEEESLSLSAIVAFLEKKSNSKVKQSKEFAALKDIAVAFPYLHGHVNK